MARGAGYKKVRKSRPLLWLLTFAQAHAGPAAVFRAEFNVGVRRNGNCFAAEFNSAERIMDGHAVNLAPMADVLGEQLLAT